MNWTVVCADDDPDILGLVTLAVQRAGLQLVAAATDGAAALAAIREHAPDLAILDISMPALTGLEVCSAVRADPALSEVRIVMLSASVDDAARRVATDAGADHFLAKPFSPRELTAWLAIGKEPR
jgi:CheY-like chemotaxis protein